MTGINPETLFESIEAFVAQSREVLKSGAMMDLAGLDSRVMLLCEEALLLSPEQRKQYADKLQRLLDDLTALGQEMTAQRNRIETELRGLPHHKKAATAYRVTEASDKREEE